MNSALKGKKVVCPSCQGGSFDTYVSRSVAVFNGAIEDHNHGNEAILEMDTEAVCRNSACEHTGVVSDFLVPLK
jgi:hypothetical protein